MSASVDIFVKSVSPLENFVSEVERLLDIDLQRLSNVDEVWYEFRDADIVLAVGEHDFENDRDLRFEDYRYDVSIRARAVGGERQRKQRREDFGSLVFRRLAATEQFDLLSTSN